MQFLWLWPRLSWPNLNSDHRWTYEHSRLSLQSVEFRKTHLIIMRSIDVLYIESRQPSTPRGKPSQPSFHRNPGYLNFSSYHFCSRHIYTLTAPFSHDWCFWHCTNKFGTFMLRSVHNMRTFCDIETSQFSRHGPVLNRVLPLKLSYAILSIPWHFTCLHRSIIIYDKLVANHSTRRNRSFEGIIKSIVNFEQTINSEISL